MSTLYGSDATGVAGQRHTRKAGNAVGAVVGVGRVLIRPIRTFEHHALSSMQVERTGACLIKTESTVVHVNAQRGDVPAGRHLRGMILRTMGRTRSKTNNDTLAPS